MAPETGLKARLKQGETLIGPIITLPSPEVSEMLALVGFDYLWIDTEHAPTDFVCAQAMIQAVGERCPCLVRVPENREVWLKRALDVGCDGLIVPQIRSAGEARAALQWSLYPPLGSRSVGITRAHQYGMAFQEYVGVANASLTVVLQVEHIEGVEHIEEIVAVPGIGAIMVGPYDLSGSLGMTGQVSHPRVQQAIARVLRSCQAANVPAGIFCADAQAARRALAQGFTLIGLGLDTLFLWQKAQAELAEARLPLRGVDPGVP